jgi:hypothetical protein
MLNSFVVKRLIKLLVGFGNWLVVPEIMGVEKRRHIDELGSLVVLVFLAELVCNSRRALAKALALKSLSKSILLVIIEL